MPVTIRDVAKRLGISHTTVSRVLNGKRGTFISRATRERVLEVAREMGYQPNPIARALASGRTQMVALWINETHTPFYAKVLHCIQQQAWQHHYEMIISAYSGERGLLLGISGLSGWPTDGILAVDLLRPIDVPLPAMPVPVVTIGVFYVESVDYVGIDLTSATIEAVQHLLAPGCRRVAYMGIDEVDSRYEAYTATVEQAGRKPEYIVVPDGRRSSARQALVEYVKARGHPDAIFCHNDDAAIGAYRALRDLDLKIPDDVALVGCDGIEDTEYLDIPISTIVQPVERMCELRWQYLECRMSAPSMPLQQTILKAQLVIRESSRRDNG